MSLISARHHTSSPAARLLARLRGDSLQSPWGAIMVFLSPALFIYAAFTVYPVIRTFYNSVHTIKPHGGEEFIGLANFITLFTADPIFWKAVVTTLTWSTAAPLA